MSKLKTIKEWGSKLSLTRRNFLKGSLAIGASVAVVGCEKSSSEPVFIGGSDLDNVVTPEDLSSAQMYTTACPHNCGAGTRCVTNVHVANGRIVRVTSDDSDVDFEGKLRDKNWLNDTRVLSCAKGRSSKFKVHHAGRLKYPLKQTKTRGDVTGFIRMKSEDMMKEIVTKVSAVYDKHGKEAIYRPDASATAYSGTFSSCSDAVNALVEYKTTSKNRKNDWSYHQVSVAGSLTGHPYPTASGESGVYSNPNMVGFHLPEIAGVVKNVVSFGSNILSTNNTLAWPYIRALEKVTQRGKHYFIGPELVDTGVTCATDWVQLRNYTDAALIMGMLHEMIVNTFESNGTLKPEGERWLDVDYLDTMVYGFFDSPEYWIHTGTTIEGTDATGEISLTEKTSDASNQYRKINAVPAGKSLSAYVMGDDKRLTNAAYGTTNYTATQYGGAGKMRNLSVCSYATTQANTQYLFKKDFSTKKTPEWAEKITGTPAATIRELAELYAKPENHPIFTEWAGGVQKQDNGVINIFAISALLVITKTFGKIGEAFCGPWGGNIPVTGVADTTTKTLDPSTGTFGATDYAALGKVTPAKPSTIATEATDDIYYNSKAPLSTKEMFNSVKMTYFTELKEALGADLNKYIPEWDMKTRYLNDDGGTKTEVKYKYNATADTDADNKKIPTYPITYNDNGNEYYDYAGRSTGGDPTYSGIRVIINPGGGIPLNQSMNANDTAQVYKALPLSGDTEKGTLEDNFCLVTFDPFFSPGARYSDYLFPATVPVEAGDWTVIGGQQIYRPAIVKAPGETKDGWRYAFEAYSAHGPALGLEYVKGSSDTGYKSSEIESLKVVDAAITGNTRFSGSTREYIYANQYQPRKPKNTQGARAEDISTGTPTTPDARHLWAGGARTAIDAYLTGTKAAPFIKFKTAPSAGAADIDTFDNDTWFNAIPDGYSYSRGGSVDKDVAVAASDPRPNIHGRFSVYNDTMIWEYKHKYSKFHGWLPADKRGQTNKDYEGETKTYPIPMYYNFEDSFNEAYGVFNGKEENNVIGKKLLTLSTSHDRYRVHSSNTPNPFLRELTTRTVGGGWASGNDWNEYAVMPANHPVGGNAPISNMLSSAIRKADPLTSSWQEIWINNLDAADRGIVDGDLVLVKNPIGAVRCVARVTTRLIRGSANLHQGGWYDPNPIDGVDDGACANTLMSYHPSRIDNGNAQQSAYVSIEKTTPPPVVPDK